MKAYIKLFFEVTPLIIFFLVNSYHGIYQATLYFMIASIIAVPVAWYIDKKVPWMPIITGIFILFFVIYDNCILLLFFVERCSYFHNK